MNGFTLVDIMRRLYSIRFTVIDTNFAENFINTSIVSWRFSVLSFFRFLITKIDDFI